MAARCISFGIVLGLVFFFAAGAVASPDGETTGPGIRENPGFFHGLRKKRPVLAEAVSTGPMMPSCKGYITDAELEAYVKSLR